MSAASAPPGGNERGLGAAGHERNESLDQLRAQNIVVSQLREGERAVPGADLGVMDGGAVLVRTGDEVLGETLADLLRRTTGGPVGKVIRLRGN